MNDVKLAVLGDKEAAQWLTDDGVLLPCPFCGKAVNLRRVNSSYTTSPTVIMDSWTVECPNGCVRNNVYKSTIFQDDEGNVVIKNNGADEARLAWNTRAPILSAEEMEILEGME